MVKTSEMVMVLMPDGPIAFDGTQYRYSKGERLYIDRLAQNFKEIILVSYVLTKGDPFYESCIHSAFQSNNIKVVELPKSTSKKQPSIFQKLWQFFLVFLKLLKIIPQANLLYLFLPSYPSALGWLSAKVYRKDYIVYGADDWVQASESMFIWDSLRESTFYKVYSHLNRFMERRIAKNALFAVVAGGQLREKYKKFGCPTYETTPRMTLSPLDIFERENTFTGDKKVLINVGSLIHDKAQHILIEAFSRVVLKHQTLKLQIVGEGPRREELLTLCKKLGVEEKVSFIGYIENQEELFKLLRSSDAFILSSVTEGFPRVLYEAMAMRLPIVTTDVGGITFLLKDKINALIVKSGDIVCLTEAICLLIEEEEIRKKIIKEASKTMEGVFSRMNPSQIAELVKLHKET